MIEIRHINGTVLYTAQNATDLRSAVEEAVMAGAYLAGAYLAGANLFRANLVGANLVGAYLAGAYLVSANLARANLARANLDGANPDGANLDGANLAGAYLDGAATGSLLGYGWALYRGEFRYGCEAHALDVWTPEFIEAKCKQHVGEPAKYVAALTGLVAWLRTLDIGAKEAT